MAATARGLLTSRSLKTCDPAHCRITAPGAYLVRSFNQQNPKKMAAAVEAYCVKCKAKRNMKDPKENIMANGRKAMKGTCPTCGTGMFKIMGK